jgi:fructan beta-fructosidase
MSLPREMYLADTPVGRRLAQRAPQGVKSAFTELPATVGGVTGTYHHEAQIDLEIGESVSASLFGETAPHFVLHRTADATATIRTIRAGVAGMPDFAHDYLVDIAYPAEGALALIFYVDRGLVELATSDGLVWITNLFFPEHPAGAISIATLDALENV